MKRNQPQRARRRVTRGSTGKLREANPQGLFFSSGGDPDENLSDYANYRPLTLGGRDIPAFKHDRLLETAYYLWLVNPLAKRMVSISTDHTIGDGITVTSESEYVNEIIKEFWDDPVNNMSLWQYQMSDQLAIFGDQCYPVEVQPVTGKVRLGYVDPADIQGIRMDPKNKRRVIEVILKPRPGEETPPLKVIMQDESQGDTFGYRVGDCFYFRINHVTNQRRGVGDLVAVQDYLDARDSMLFDRADRAKLLGAYVWLVTLTGASKSQIADWKSRNKIPPKSGSVKAVNENEKWEALTPDLKASDAKVELDALKAEALIGGGPAAYPLHWFAEGENANRATALEMGSPVYRGLKRRQAMIKFMIEEIVAFVLDQAVIAGALSESEHEKGFEVQMPEIASRDLERASATALNAVTAITASEDREYISHQTARRLMAKVLSMLGQPVDAGDEKSMVEEESLSKAQQGTEDVEKANGELADMLGMRKVGGVP